MDVHDVEPCPVAAQPPREMGGTDTRVPSAGDKGPGSKQLDRHPVELGRHVPVAAGSTTVTSWPRLSNSEL